MMQRLRRACMPLVTNVQFSVLELLERLLAEEYDPENPDEWILDRARSYSRKVSTKAGLMSKRACHTFHYFEGEVDFLESVDSPSTSVFTSSLFM